MSAGNPFFAIELARNIKAPHSPKIGCDPPIPDSIRALIERRFTSLSDRALALMHHAAVLGTRVSYATLAKAVELPSLDVAGVFLELERNGIMDWAEGCVSFRHDLLRKVAWDQVPGTLRSELHFRAAKSLIETEGSAPEIARHYSLAGDSEQSRKWAVVGADSAEKVFAFREAAELLQQALEHTYDEGDRLVLCGRIGRLYVRICDYVKARPFLSEGLRLASDSNAPVSEIVEARRQLIFLDIYSCKLTMAEAGRALRDFHTELAQTGSETSGIEAQVLSTLFWTAARCFDTTLAEEAITRIRLLHQKAAFPEVRYRTARSLGIYERYRGHLEEAERLLREAVDIATALGDDSFVTDAYVGLSTLLSRSLSRDLTTHILSVAVPLAEKTVNPRRLVSLLGNCSVCYSHLGDFDLAEALLHRALQVLSVEDDTSDLATSIYYNLGYLEELRGNMSAAEKHWRTASSTSIEGSVLPVALESFAGLGRLAARRGDMAKARALGARALRLAHQGSYFVDEKVGLVLLLAMLHCESGRREKALRLLSRTADEALDSDVPLFLGTQLSRIQLLLRMNRRDEAIHVANQISTVARRHRAPWWEMKAQEALCTEDPVTSAEY
jgi:tetratricopeptide (TPR) repeat protein